MATSPPGLWAGLPLPQAAPLGGTQGLPTFPQHAAARQESASAQVQLPLPESAVAMQGLPAQPAAATPHQMASRHVEALRQAGVAGARAIGVMPGAPESVQPDQEMTRSRSSGGDELVAVAAPTDVVSARRAAVMAMTSLDALCVDRPAVVEEMDLFLAPLSIAHHGQ